MSKQHSADPVLRRRAKALASVRSIPYTAALRSLTEAKKVADTHTYPGLRLAQAGKYTTTDKPWDDAADRVIGAARAGCVGCQTVGMAEVTDHERANRRRHRGLPGPLLTFHRVRAPLSIRKPRDGTSMQPAH
jgi:hypothetical protein